MTVALGVMAKAPVAGHCKTRLCPPLTAVQAAALHEALLRDTLDAVGALHGVTPVLFAAPEHRGVETLQALFPSWTVVAQAGADLGARMEHALGELLHRAPVALIIGADAPDAPMQDALDAAAWLTADAAHRAVMGPSDDGGYWLVGLATLQPALFRNIPWSTATVAAATRLAAQAAGVGLLEVGVALDVDDLAALRALWKRPATPSTRHTRAFLEQDALREIVGGVG